VEILILKLLEEYRSQTDCEMRTRIAEEIYLHMEGFLRAYVYSRVKPSAMEDVLQLIVIGIVKGLQKCRAKTEKDIRIWYCTIARNKVSDYVRKKKSDRLDFLSLDDLTDVLNGSGFFTSPSGVRHDLDLVLKILEQIKPGCCKLLWDFYGFDFGHSEISKEMGLKPDNIRMKIKRCLKSAREIARRLK
jgi:RNA polymerase sigma factor (sigma-70 family)